MKTIKTQKGKNIKMWKESKHKNVKTVNLQKFETCQNTKKNKNGQNAKIVKPSKCKNIKTVNC